MTVLPHQPLFKAVFRKKHDYKAKDFKYLAPELCRMTAIPTTAKDKLPGCTCHASTIVPHPPHLYILVAYIYIQAYTSHKTGGRDRHRAPPTHTHREKERGREGEDGASEGASPQHII